MRNWAIPFFIAVLFLLSSSFSAEFPVSGRVLNRSGSPISNASVVLSNSKDSTISDENGYFGEITPITSLFNSSNQSYTKITQINNTLHFQNLKSSSKFQFNLTDFRGRTLINKSLKTDISGRSMLSLGNSSSRIANGVYLIRLSNNELSLTFKTLIKENQLNTITSMNTSSYKVSKTSRNRRAADTLIISHASYQTSKTVLSTLSENVEIVLDPIGPDDIPILYPDVSGKIYIRNSFGNISDTLKAYSVMPPAGIQEWSEVVDGKAPTGVIYDSVLTTSTTMKAHMIRAGMEHDQDWQISFATAIIGSNPFKDLSHIVIRYMVETSLDSIALSLNAVDGSEVVGESTDHGAFRAVLKKGVSNPGKFVTDTLSMDDFTIGWSDDPNLNGISLGDHLDSLDNYSAIAFTNELLPWDYDLAQPVNDGDTINITVAGILFGTKWDSVINDTTIDTTINKYPLHKNIMTSTFWCGEGASGDNDFITNTTSAWDIHWGQRFGIEDKPFLDRDANFIPTSSKFTGEENPFYFALPYNDMGPGVYDGSGPDDNSAPVDGYYRKENSYTNVHWADEMSAADWGYRTSMCKNRWVKINVSGENKFCYAQWEDAGPYYYNDHSYVWGTSKPANTTDAPYSGIDLSPSVCLYLGRTLQEWGAPSFEVDWCFIDEADVPDGPWKQHITTTQIVWQ